jgi:CHAT domain-containing protein
VVPDGALQLANLAALPVGEREYLVENGPTIHMLTTERDLVPPDAEPVVGRGLFAMGGPDFEGAAAPAIAGRDAGGAGLRGEVVAAAYRGGHSNCGDFRSLRWGPLPGTARECEDLAGLWNQSAGSGGGVVAARGADLLIGSRASEEAFKTLGPGHRVLHLATHGFFLAGRCASAADAARTGGGRASGEAGIRSGENPLVLSGLVLAGANHRDAAAPGQEDGVLTAEEVAALDLSGVEWAVLSACETGVGEVRAGEGVFGLRRAFQVAGARTLIMSLWPVEDQAARQWMRELYQARLERRLSTAEAVREASLTVLRDRRAAHQSTHPFYWGAFVAAGDWR